MIRIDRERRRIRVAATVLALALGALGAGLALLQLKEAPARAPAVSARELAREDARRAALALLRARDSAPAAVLSGRVRAADGTAIAGALVCAGCASCDPSARPPSSCVSSDAHGAYALRGADKAVVISASAPGFASGHANSGLPLQPGPEPRSGLDIVLERGGARIAGVVVDALGGPVVQARVRLARFADSVHSLLEVDSDAEGRFELWSAPGLVTVRAEAPGYAPAQRSKIAPSEDIELRMTPASVVRGRVVAFGSGKGVPAIEVRALARGSATHRASALSDERGDFSLPSLEPGVYKLIAAGERWRGGAAQPIAVGLVEVIGPVTVTVVPAASVRGRVTIGDDDQPCPRGLVLLEAAQATISASGTAVGTIEADGNVRMPGLAPGRYHATVQCLQHVLRDGPRELEVGERDLEVHWRVEPGLSLVVNARDEVDRPVAHARMLLVMPPEREGATPASMPLVADAQGRATISGDLEPGRYSVEPDGGLAGQAVTFELRAGAAPTEITLRLQGSATLLVRARDARGQGVTGLQLNARSLVEGSAAAPGAGVLALPRSPLGVRAVELGAGSYRIGPLASGRYAVQAHDGVNPARDLAPEPGGGIELRAGEQRELELRLDRGGVLRGKVVDERGDPVPSVWVSASADEPGSRSAWVARMHNPPVSVMTDQEGGFTLEGLQPGARFLVQAKQPHASAAAVRDVAEGSTVTIVLPEAAAIRGELVDEQGRAVPDGIVHARHEPTRTTRSAPVLADGTFAIDGIPPGRITVSAQDAASVLAQTDVELRSGQALSGLRLRATPAAVEVGSPHGAAADAVEAQTGVKP